jgi:3-deoxy-D-manno-octulosonate 8-phosphate phosphatase (KDO 8-P phosphatase)
MMTMIKYFITDVDGTLTDGKIYMGEHGELMKAFNIKDGYALHDLLPDNKIIPVIVTGRQSQIVLSRANELEITLVFQGVKDKLYFLTEFAKKQNITLDEIGYIGDDISDLECIKSCGISGCPADAPSDVMQYSHFVCKYKGGEGAVREFAEYIVRRNGK